MRVNEIIPGPEGYPNQSMTFPPEVNRFRDLAYLEVCFLAVALEDYLGDDPRDPVAVALLDELDELVGQ